MARAISKAVVLARGLGKRMRRDDAHTQLRGDQRSVADAGLKAMIPVGELGRPFIDYVLSALADAGFREIVLVIGPEHGVVRDYFERQRLTRISVAYATQPEARGTADAVLAAEPFAGSDEFLVLNSDNLYPAEALRALRALGEPGTVLFDADSLVRNSNIPADRVRAFATCEVRDGYLASIREKPENADAIAHDTLVSMNVWRFAPAIFQYCRSVPLSSRGEYELTGAINRAIEAGMRLRVERSTQGVLDLSQRADVAHVAERLRGVEVRL